MSLISLALPARGEVSGKIRLSPGAPGLLRPLFIGRGNRHRRWFLSGERPIRSPTLEGVGDHRPWLMALRRSPVRACPGRQSQTRSDRVSLPHFGRLFD